MLYGSVSRSSLFHIFATQLYIQKQSKYDVYHIIVLS
jgi:hypothetical protein